MVGCVSGIGQGNRAGSSELAWRPWSSAYTALLETSTVDVASAASGSSRRASAAV